MPNTNVQVDSELMLHMMASQPITTAKHFTAVHDEAHNPLLFSVSSDGQFLVVKADGSGSNKIINLSQVLGITKPVAAFAVSQSSANEGWLFVAFAIGASNSELRVFKPILPADLDLPQDVLRSKLLSSNAQPSNLQITNLYLNTSANNSYPLLVAAIKDANGDINIARVNVLSTAWEWTTDLRIPQIAKGFIDMCPATLRLGDGIFVAYKVSGRTAVLFSTTALGRKTFIDLQVPPNANIGSLGTFKDERGLSHLLLFGEGLFHFGPFSRSGDVAATLSTDALFRGLIDNTFVAQSGSTITTWFKTSNLALVYQNIKASGSDASVVGSPVPVLSERSSAEFAPLIDPSSKSQSLIVLDSSFQLSILEQSIQNSQWNLRPFLLASFDRMEEIPAFYTHIGITDSSNWPVSNTSFLLSSSAWVSVLVNGVQYFIGTTPIPISTDAKGTLTLVTPSDTIACPTFTLANAPNSSLLPPQGVTIEPSSKAKTKLAAIKSGDDLRNAKTSDGTPFLDGSTATHDEVDRAAKVISDMHVALASPAALNSQIPTIRAMASSRKGLGWEFFRWVKEVAHDVTDWAVERASDGWHFVVTLAGEVWSFVLDGVNSVAKAASWVFDKIGVVFKNVINFLGYLFNWNDIKNTRDSIKLMFNGGLDYVTNFLLNNQSTVGNWIDGMESKLIHSLGLDFPSGVASQQASPRDGSSPKSDATLSAPANVGVYHYEQAEKAQENVPDAVGALMTLYKDVIQPVIVEATKDVQAIANTIIKLFNSNKSMSLDQIFKELGREILELVFGVFKKIATGMMKLISDVITGLRDILNMKINIPVITPLLEKLGIPRFSYVDEIALILAIPVTVLSKAITGRPPLRIQNFDYGSMVQGKSIPKETLLAYNELASYVDITVATIMTIVKVYKITTAEAKPFSLGDFALGMIVKLCTFPYDRESPAWDYRVAAWAALTGNICVKAICEKTGLPVQKINAGADIVLALAAFSLAQVIHAEEYKKNFIGKDNATTTLSVGISIFQFASGLAGAYGTLAPDPLDKAIAAVIIAGTDAYMALLKTGKSARAIELKTYNYIAEGV